MTACPLCRHDPAAVIPAGRSLGQGYLALIIRDGKLSRWVRHDAAGAYRAAKRAQQSGSAAAVVPVDLVASPRAADRAFEQLAAGAPPDLLGSSTTRQPRERRRPRLVPVLRRGGAAVGAARPRPPVRAASAACEAC